jgi:hypothetical protein
MGRPKGSKIKKAKAPAPPKVEFAPVPPPAPELPPQAGIGPDVNYDTLPEREVNMDLLKAGVSDPFLPSEPLNKETTKDVSNSGMKVNAKPEVFTRTPPVRKEGKTMSHPGTMRTTF